MKIVIPLEKSGLLIKVASETIEDETKQQIDGFVSIFLGEVGSALLGNLLPGKGVIRAGWRNNQSRAAYLVPCHPLTNFEI